MHDMRVKDKRVKAEVPLTFPKNLNPYLVQSIRQEIKYVW